MGGTYVILLENITKDYGNHKGIFDVNLEFSPGIIGILGENGAGKSTLFKLLLGLLKPDKGNIFILGKNLWEGDTFITSKRWIGYVPPENYLVPSLTGRENIELMAYLRFQDKNQYHRLMPYIDILEMKDVLDEPLSTYSSGMQKKLHILVSLLGNPPILIWDEPYNQLDIVALMHMKKLLLAYAEETKATILFSSHIIEMVEDLCSHVCILHQGHVHFYGDLPPRGKLTPYYVDIIQKKEPAFLKNSSPKVEILSPCGYDIPKELKGDSMPLIEVKNAKKDYPLGKTTVHALRGVNLTVEAGDFFSIVGPSGSGKTTLLNLIGCIDHPTEGEVIIDGQNVSQLSDKELTNIRLYKVGFIFQTFNLIPVLNVRENVEFPLLLMKDRAGLTKAEINERVERLIEEVGLKDFITHKPAELSGGQRQRVAIARALVTKPAIVLADEPTANLDSETGESILAIMRRLNESEHITFIFSTHNPDVLKYAKRIVRLKDGLVVSEE